MAIKTKVDPAVLLRDFEGWKRTVGLADEDMSQAAVGRFMASRETDPQRMERAAMDLGAAAFNKDRTVTNVMAGTSTASGRPWQAFATMPTQPAAGVSPDAMRAMQADGQRTNEQTGRLVTRKPSVFFNADGTPAGSGTQGAGAFIEAKTGMAAPPPVPNEEAVRNAMGYGERVAAAGPMSGPPAAAAGGMAGVMDLMKLIPANDRLTLSMWQNSRDTGGLRRYNDVAKKYGMAPLAVKPDLAERRRAAGGVPNWAPDGKGGVFNPMTGERQAAEGAPAEQWKDDGKGGTYNLFTGEQRPAAAGPVQGKDRFLETSIPGVFLDSTTQKTVKVDGAGRPAKDNFITFDNGDVWNAETQQTVRKGSTDYKDEYQGPNVAREAGKGTFLLGTWNDKREAYDFKPATSGMTVTSKDGTQISLGGDGNYDFSKLPVYADKNSGLAAKAAGGAEAAKAGPEGEAPEGYVHTYPTGRKVKKVNGKWVPVEGA